MDDPEPEVSTSVFRSSFRILPSWESCSKFTREICLCLLVAPKRRLILDERILMSSPRPIL